jgi:hypothetical protein
MANHPNRPKKQWFKLEAPDEAILRALFDLYGAGAVMAVLSRFQTMRDRGSAAPADSAQAERILCESRSAVARINAEALAGLIS